jgi:hypothetical protein
MLIQVTLSSIKHYVERNTSSLLAHFKTSNMKYLDQGWTDAIFKGSIITEYGFSELSMALLDCGILLT